MHKIFFERRCIIICNPDDQALSDPNAMEFHVGEKIDIRTRAWMSSTSPTWNSTELASMSASSEGEQIIMHLLPK